MANLFDLQATINQISDIILVNPKKDVGITAQLTADESFLFHVKGEEMITLSSDVTDHYVENNTAIQDHVALKPEMIQVGGYIGELNNVPPKFLLPLKAASERIQTLAPFVPALSSSALRAYNQAAQTYAVAAKAKAAAVSAFSTLTGGKGDQVQTAQQEAFNKFYGWWLKRQQFTVQTPWCILSDMIIMTLRATQNEDTKMVTDFEITFKKMRFAQTIVGGSHAVLDGRAAAQSAALTNNGVSQPQADIGLLQGISGSAVG